MIANFIRRVRGTAALRERRSDGLVPIVVDSSGWLRIGSSEAGGTRTIGGTAGLWAPVSTTSSETATLTTAQSGTVLVCTASSGTQTFTLPATEAGLVYTFICGHADGEINISPNAADKITGKGFAGSDDGDIKNTAASNAVGDTCTLVGDGGDGWIATVVTGTWAVV